MKAAAWEWGDRSFKRRLVFRLLPRRLMRFGGRYWTEDGYGVGILVETTTVLGEVWHEWPHNCLKPLDSEKRML